MSTPDQNFYSSILKNRNIPVFKDGKFELSPSGLAHLVSEKEVRFDDPNAIKMESDDQEMRHRFKISASSIDRSGDIVVPNGCLKSLSRYKSNPVVFFNHMSFDSLPIAMSQNPKTKEFALEVKDDCIIADAYFHCTTQASQDIYELVKLGYLKGASIGFRPLKGIILEQKSGKPSKDNEIDFTSFFPGIRFDEWELLEWSVVNIPCNSDALEGYKSWISKKTFKDDSFKKMLLSVIPKETKLIVPVNFPETPKREEVPNSEIVVEDKTDKREENNISKLPDTQPETKTEANPEVIKEITEVLENIIHKEVPEIKELDKDLVAYIDLLVEQKMAEQKDHMADLVPPDLSVVNTPEEAPKDPKKTAPIGAGVLLKVCKNICDSTLVIENKLSQVDNPKTIAFLEELTKELETLEKKIIKFGKKVYPDWFAQEYKDIETIEEKSIEEAPKDNLPGVSEKKDPWNGFDLNKLNTLLENIEKLSTKTNNSLYSLTGKKL